MNKLTAILFLLICSQPVWAQQCACPTGITVESEEGTPNRVFRFANGTELAICGYTSPDGDSSYNKFSLVSCSDHKIIEEWGVNETSKAEFKNDALYINDMYALPIGQSFSTIWRPFYIHKFYFKNGALAREVHYNKALGKYTKQQLEAVFAEYKKLPEGGKQNLMHVAKMLFFAAYSGNKEAEGYLNNFEQKFGPFDSVTAEEWKTVNVGYIKWKNYMKGN